MASNNKTSIWWALGLIIVFAVLYFKFCGDKEEEVVAETETLDLINEKENNETVNSYVNFIAAADTNQMTLDHAYTSNAILQLSDAINAMADAVGFNVKADLTNARSYANKITIDPFDTSHADNIRYATDIYSTAIQNLQRSKYPSLSNEVFELKNASTAIDPNTLTLKQRDAVKDFFKKAASVLNKMN